MYDNKTTKVWSCKSQLKDAHGMKNNVDSDQNAVPILRIYLMFIAVIVTVLKYKNC